jgi:hypothetical protein
VHDLATQRFRQAYAQRITTSSVYRPQPRTTYSILLASAPRFTRPATHYSQIAPGLAPCRSDLMAYQLGELSWDAFARRYWRDLTALPYLRDRARLQVSQLLDRYPTLALLGFERAPSKAAEAQVPCVRRLVRAWLLGETPVEMARR